MKKEQKGIVVFSIAFVLTSLLIIFLIICMSTEKVYSEMDCIDIYNSNTKEFDLVKNYIIEHQDGLKEYSSHMYSVDEKLKDTNPDSNTDEAIQTLYAAGVKSIHIIMDQNNRSIEFVYFHVYNSNDGSIRRGIEWSADRTAESIIMYPNHYILSEYWYVKEFLGV